MMASLPAVEAWIRLLGLALGAAVVVIVPVTGFMKEYWAYRARLRESDGLRADAARAVPAHLFGPILEIADLTSATRDLGHAAHDLAAALREAGRQPRTDPERAD